MQSSIEIVNQSALATFNSTMVELQKDCSSSAQLLAGIPSVTDDDTFAEASRLLKDAKHAVKAVGDYRKSITSVLDAKKKAIMSVEKNATKKVESELDRVQSLVDRYATEVEMRRREAQEKAEREAREAAEKAAAAEMEASKKAEEERKAAAAFGINAPVAVVPAPITDPVIPSVYIPPKATASTANVVMVVDIVVADPNAVPREFLSVDEKKIRSFIDYQKKNGVPVKDIVINGITITERAQVRAR